MVRKSWHTDALICLEPVLVPPLSLVSAGETSERVRRHAVRFHDLESSCQDEHIDLVPYAIGRNHRGFIHPGDWVGFKMDVVAVERLQIFVVEAWSLAAQRVARCQLLPNDRVGNLPAHIADCCAFDRRRQRYRGMEVRCDGKGEFDKRLAGSARGDLRPRCEPEKSTQRGGHREVEFRQAPYRCALEDGECVDVLRYRGDQLHRRGARPNDGDSFSGEVLLVVPTRRVHRDPAEVRNPRYVRRFRSCENPGGIDDESSCQFLIRRGIQTP